MSLKRIFTFVLKKKKIISHILHIDLSDWLIICLCTKLFPHPLHMEHKVTTNGCLWSPTVDQKDFIFHQRFSANGDTGHGFKLKYVFAELEDLKETPSIGKAIGGLLYSVNMLCKL